MEALVAGEEPCTLFPLSGVICISKLGKRDMVRRGAFGWPG